jgi:hypothetical protein
MSNIGHGNYTNVKYFITKPLSKVSPQIFFKLKIFKKFGEKQSGIFFLKNKIENENTNPTFSPFDHDVNVIRSNINYVNGCNLDKWLIINHNNESPNLTNS